MRLPIFPLILAAKTSGEYLNLDELSDLNDSTDWSIDEILDENQIYTIDEPFFDLTSSLGPDSDLDPVDPQLEAQADFLTSELPEENSKLVDKIPGASNLSDGLASASSSDIDTYTMGVSTDQATNWDFFPQAEYDKVIDALVARDPNEIQDQEILAAIEDAKLEKIKRGFGQKSALNADSVPESEPEPEGDIKSAKSKDVKNYSKGSHEYSDMSTDKLKQFIRLKRIKQLKQMILWLQPDPKFGMFCFYGCWCLPDGIESFNGGYSQGKGKPVDEVDRSCMAQHRCWHCAQKDYGESCHPETVKYNFQMLWDVRDKDNTDKRGIICTDEWKDGDSSKAQKANCKRSVCECDKALALKLRDQVKKNIWSTNYHAMWGGFDSEKSCEKFQISEEQKLTEGEEKCCGEYEGGNRFPFKSHYGARDCCGSKTFDTGILECCDNDLLRKIDHCPGPLHALW